MQSSITNDVVPRLAFDIQECSIAAENLISYTVNHVSENPKYIYDFYIDALGRELEAIYNSDTIHLASNQCYTEKFLSFPRGVSISWDYTRHTDAMDKISLTDWNVACSPRDKQRVAWAIRQVQEEGYHRREGDECEGFAYPLLNFAVVTNAHHHSMAARVVRNKSLTMNANIVDISSAFPTLRVRADSSWCTSDGSRVFPEKPDPRFALMYEFARRKALLETKPKVFWGRRSTLCTLVKLPDVFFGPQAEITAARTTDSSSMPATEPLLAPTLPPAFLSNNNRTARPGVVLDEGELPAIKRFLMRLMNLEIKNGQIYRKNQEN